MYGYHHIQVIQWKLTKDCGNDQMKFGRFQVVDSYIVKALAWCYFVVMSIQYQVLGCPQLQLTPWVCAEIFPGGGQRRHFAYHFQVADNAMQTDVHKALYPFYTTKIKPHVTVTATEMSFVGSNNQVYYANLHNNWNLSKQGMSFPRSIAMVLTKPQNMTLFYLAKRVNVV